MQSKLQDWSKNLAHTTSLQLKEADERCPRVSELALDSVATRSRYGGGRESRKGRQQQQQQRQGVVAMAVRGAWSSHRRRWRHLLPLLHRHTLLAYNKIFFFSFVFFFWREFVSWWMLFQKKTKKKKKKKKKKEFCFGGFKGFFLRHVSR